MTTAQMLILLASGVGAGLLGSLLGLGGGILIVPILVLVLKVPVHHAIATSLLCVIATSSAAASKNVRIGIANVRLGMTLEMLTVCGAMVGGAIAGLLPGRTLLAIFASCILLMALPMARGGRDEEPEEEKVHEEEPILTPSFISRLDGHYFDEAEKKDVRYRVRRLPFAMGVSSLAGLLSGLLGVGGGIIKVPALTIFCDVPMKAAAATSNFMIGVTALASAVIYYGRGELSPLISAASVAGVFAGSRIGASVSSRVRGESLRRMFAIVMVLIAVQLLWKSYAGEVQ